MRLLYAPVASETRTRDSAGSCRSTSSRIKQDGAGYMLCYTMRYAGHKVTAEALSQALIGAIHAFGAPVDPRSPQVAWRKSRAHVLQPAKSPTGHHDRAAVPEHAVMTEAADENEKANVYEHLHSTRLECLSEESRVKALPDRGSLALGTNASTPVQKFRGSLKRIAGGSTRGHETGRPNEREQVFARTIHRPRPS